MCDTTTVLTDDPDLIREFNLICRDAQLGVDTSKRLLALQELLGILGPDAQKSEAIRRKLSSQRPEQAHPYRKSDRL